MTNSNKTPRAWIGCLASYNAGVLHGEWIDLDTDEDVVADAIAEVLKTSPEPNAEEWIVCDTENIPSGLVGEYATPAELAEVTEALETHGIALSVALTVTHSLDEALTMVAECYRGEFESKRAFAENWFESMNGFESVPDWAQGYIDFDAIVRDLECGGTHFVRVEGSVHVFDALR